MAKKILSRKALVKKLDTVFSKWIRERDKICIVCGSSDRPTNGHLFSRTAYSTRWDEMNCNLQCWPCNYRHEFDFYPYQQAFIKKYGEEALHETHRRYNTPRKWSNSDLQDLIERYSSLKP